MEKLCNTICVTLSLVSISLRTPRSFEIIDVSSLVTSTLDLWYRLQDTGQISTYYNPLKPNRLILSSEGATSTLAHPYRFL